MTAVALPIGFVVSHVVMAALFFGLFMPIGLLFRLLGRDSLHRKSDPDASTYWIRRKAVADVRRYFRQF